MKIENRMQMKSWKQKIVLLASLLGTALLASAPAQAKPDVPVVVDAMTKAKEAPTAEGRWVVTAKVMMYSYTRGVGFTNKMDATGWLSAVPDSADELSGTLAMRVDDGPYFTHKLRLRVARDGKVGIQWLIKNKPFLAREIAFFQAEAVGKDSLAARGIDWNGLKRTLIVTLSSQRVKASAPPAIHVPFPSAKPIGKRYKLDGRLVVTNSEDGFLDNTCEIFGYLFYRLGANGGKEESKVERCVTIIEQDANKGFTLHFDKNIYLDHIFADPKTEYFQIDSNIQDEDGGGMTGDNDIMNFNEIRWISLAKLAASCEKDGEWNLEGDRDSENVEIYFTVKFVKDLY